MRNSPDVEQLITFPLQTLDIRYPFLLLLFFFLLAFIVYSHHGSDSDGPQHRMNSEIWTKGERVTQEFSM